MMKLRFSFLYSIPVTCVALFSSPTVIAEVPPTYGALTVFNGLANHESATGIGYTASPIKVQVSDSVGVCHTTSNVAYNGAVLIPWSNSNTHSSSVCKDIVSVTITPLAHPNLQVTVYGGGAGSVTFTAPTTVHGQMVLMPVGRSTPITPADATHWGNSVAGVAPTFNAADASLATAGIPGVSHSYGVRARQFLMAQGIKIPSQKEDTSE
jgi:hypothetical protein